MSRCACESPCSCLAPGVSGQKTFVLRWESSYISFFKMPSTLLPRPWRNSRAIWEKLVLIAQWNCFGRVYAQRLFILLHFTVSVTSQSFPSSIHPSINSSIHRSIHASIHPSIPVYSHSSIIFCTIHIIIYWLNNSCWLNTFWSCTMVVSCFLSAKWTHIELWRIRENCFIVDIVVFCWSYERRRLCK